MQFIKNITSKNFELQQNTIKSLILNCEVENFKLLTQNADFIFPFIKEKITKTFVNLVNKNDLKTIFEFTKIYSYDFEEMMVKSLVKFANEELTDKILELFENGTDEQKTYCASYFSKVKDTLALDLLYENFSSDFEPLKTNCIQTLKEFNDTKILEIAKNGISNTQEEIEKLDYYKILSVFNEVNFIVENGINSPLSANIVSILLDYNNFDSIKEKLDKVSICRILNILIENYPENISLDTILYYQIFDFIKLIETYQDDYSNNILLFAKTKFKEFSNNDIYTFDFDKSIKTEVKEISQYLDKLNLDYNFDILNSYQSTCEFNLILDLIFEYKIKQYDKDLAFLINNKKIINGQLIRSVEILSLNNDLDLVNKEIFNNIENENIKAVILNYFK